MALVKFNLSFLFACILSVCFAQWQPLNSPTDQKLNDVDFLTPEYGVIVGGNGIFLTSSGGSQWENINVNRPITGTIYSAKILNFDTIVVSTRDNINLTGEIYITENRGLDWIPIYSDMGFNHKIELGCNSYFSLFAAGSNLIHTSENIGGTWDTLVNSVGGMTSLDILKFTDNGQIGQLSGLVSGFLSYSSYFYRSEDGGNTWFPGDIFSFPNEDALTTMCFNHPDTAFLFTNHYNGFMPSNQNGLIKIYDFTKVEIFPGDTVYSFSNVIVNTATPTYMNDAIFMTYNEAYALGDDGKVYKTINGGIQWVIDYTAGEPLYKMDSVSGIMYAVGDNGKLIKFTNTASISEEENENIVKIYPNPVNNKLTINSTTNISKITISNIEGKEIISSNSFPTNYITIDMSEFSKGIYILEAKTDSGKIIKRKIIH